MSDRLPFNLTEQELGYILNWAKWAAANDDLEGDSLEFYQALDLLRMMFYGNP